MQRETAIRLVVVVAWALPCTAAGATPPFYNPAVYCDRISHAGGGPGRDYGTCFRREQTAYDHVKAYWDGLSARARTYCDGMAEPAGSYQILETCLQQLGVSAKDPGDKSPPQ